MEDPFMEAVRKKVADRVRETRRRFNVSMAAHTIKPKSRRKPTKRYVIGQ